MTSQKMLTRQKEKAGGTRSQRQKKWKKGAAKALQQLQRKRIAKKIRSPERHWEHAIKDDDRRSEGTAVIHE